MYKIKSAIPGQSDLECIHCGGRFESVYVMTDWFNKYTVHVCEKCRTSIITQIANDYVIMREIDKTRKD